MWGFSDRKKFWRYSKIDYSDNLFTNVFKFTFKNTKAVFSLRILFFLRTLCQTFRTGHWSLTMGDNL